MIEKADLNKISETDKKIEDYELLANKKLSLVKIYEIYDFCLKEFENVKRRNSGILNKIISNREKYIDSRTRLSKILGILVPLSVNSHIKEILKEKYPSGENSKKDKPKTYQDKIRKLQREIMNYNISH